MGLIMNFFLFRKTPKVKKYYLFKSSMVILRI